MRKFNVVEWVVFVLVIVGALNWGFVGFFNFNFVDQIFGNMEMVARVIYDLVGVAGVYLIYLVFKWHQ